MYQTLTFLHSIVRWLVILSLCYSIFRACLGYFRKLNFSQTDNTIRHSTATVAHIQLLLGIALYSVSPMVSYFWKNFKEAKESWDTLFFGLIHMALMLIAITLITIGSALSKRKLSDKEKFRVMLLFYAIALVIIFVAIPWPFSPLAKRPYLR